MSWLDKIKNTKLTITHTVRGKDKLHDIEYKPLWLNARRVREFHVSQFDFPEKEGTLVDRREARGRRYNVEFIFQGPDHLVHAENFDESSKSKYPWQIIHPLYGKLYVQPLILEYNNSAMNVTRITGEVMETITDRKILNIDPVATIEAKKLETDATAQDVYMTEVPVPEVGDVKVMKRSVGDIYNGIVGGIKETTDYEGFFNAFENANAFIDELLDPPGELADTLSGALGNTIAMVGLPARFAAGVASRVDMLKGAYELLGAAARELTEGSLKRLFELQGGCIVTSMALAAALPQPDDYRTRREVAEIIEVLQGVYDDLAEVMDVLQSEVGNVADGFIPSADVALGLQEVVTYTVQHLYDIAAGARQERVLVLEEDIDIVQLAHRLYGLVPDDSTIDRLVKDNDIAGDELYLLLRGRRVVYYL